MATLATGVCSFSLDTTGMSAEQKGAFGEHVVPVRGLMQLQLLAFNRIARKCAAKFPCLGTSFFKRFAPDVPVCFFRVSR